MEIAAIIFVVFLIAVAGITFFLLKRAVKMAMRAAIVALILMIAVVGGLSLWWFGTTATSNKQPATTNKSR
jgi:thiol:disulfide interchange protein